MEYLQIGEIVRPQGIKGEVKLRAMTSDPDRYARLESVYLLKKGEYVEYKVKKGRCNDGFAVLLLEGVKDRNEAELLRGVKVFVDREHAIELDEDENFVVDLIGLTVLDDETGKELGTLTEVLTPSIQKVYVVKGEREIMIPAVDEFIREINVAGGYVRVKLIEGM